MSEAKFGRSKLKTPKMRARVSFLPTLLLSTFNTPFAYRTPLSLGLVFFFFFFLVIYLLINLFKCKYFVLAIRSGKVYIVSFFSFLACTYIRVLSSLFRRKKDQIARTRFFTGNITSLGQDFKRANREVLSSAFAVFPAVSV
ncbi:hypothetical protein V1514DRAFT_155394 [Lipomyces japonicus]|uniref:uncharacterized protein n=1 Tax=Lipomyces japonicus TaxID=56871 RepID=UPI0034CDFB05